MQTEKTYHEDESLHGGYQYFSFDEMLNELLLETTETRSHLSHVRRSYIISKLKNGIRELNREVQKTIYKIERTVSSDLYFEMPQDYVDWVRVSVVNDDFTMTPLKINNKAILATGYLQDHEYRLLFDSNEEIISADSSNAYNKKMKSYKVCGCSKDVGQFAIDESRGRLLFSDTLVSKNIIVEYISDGLSGMDLKDSDVRIHKVLKDALFYYTYSACVMHRNDVPQNEKQRARNMYLKAAHQAKLDSSNFLINEIITSLNR